MAGAAMKEVREQLMAQGGQGQVWVQDWNNRFKEQLGTLKEFLGSRSDVTIIPGNGNKFTVAMKSSSGKGKGKGKTQQALMAIQNGNQKGKSGGKGSAAVSEKIPPWMKKSAAPVHAPPGRQTKGSVGYSPVVAEAIKEIRAQLQDQGGQGKVWVDQWRQRFGDELGDMREFLESRSDKFQIIPTAGRSFEVALLTPGSARAPASQIYVKPKQASAQGRQASAQGGHDPLVGEVIREIKDQLAQAGGMGNVWIENWNERFGSVAASPREFMESRPDKFVVIPMGGKKFGVALTDFVGKVAQQMDGKVGSKRNREDSQNSGPPLKKSKKTQSAEAKRECIKQLKKASNTEGKVWIDGWNQKYKESLGSLREFLESNSETFIINEGEGSKYTVSLME